MNSDKIKKRLEIYFSGGKVEVFDTRGTGDHFSIIIISNKLLPSVFIILVIASLILSSSLYDGNTIETEFNKFCILFFK